MNPFILTAIIAGLGVAFFVVIFLAICFRTVVSTNDVHIVQSSHLTTSYGRGQTAGNTYYKWPSWVPYFGVKTIIFPVSVFDIDISNYAAYDKDRVPFKVDIMAFFRITDSALAAERIHSFEGLKEQLIGIIQGAIRSMLATYPIHEILEGRSQFGEHFTKEVDTQLKEWGVQTVKSIELMDIRDSESSQVIANIMEKQKSFIEMESRVAVAANHKAAQTAEIEAKREVDIAAQEAAQQVGIRQAEKEKQVGIAAEKSKQEIAVQAADTAQKDQAVARVKQVKAAEIARDVQIVEAEQEKQTQTLIAEGKLAATRLEAEGITAQGEARANAEKAMQLAPVQAQITLAKEIGENQGYQEYLIRVRTVEASQAVGIEQAKALQNAEVKVIANGGSAPAGVSSINELFSAKGGTQLGGMLEAFVQSDAGKAVLAAATNLPKAAKPQQLGAPPQKPDAPKGNGKPKAA